MRDDKSSDEKNNLNGTLVERRLGGRPKPPEGSSPARGEMVESPRLLRTPLADETSVSTTTGHRRLP
jgi:hypothetical protein